MLNTIIGALQPLLVGTIVWAMQHYNISADSITGIGMIAGAIASVAHSAVTTVAVAPKS